jgi:hypothetical protein
MNFTVLTPFGASLIDQATGLIILPVSPIVCQVNAFNDT